MGGDLVGEYPLRNVSIEEVRAFTGQPRCDPMFDRYPLSQRHGEWAREEAGVTLDFLRYSYYLEGKFAAKEGGPVSQWVLEVFEPDESLVAEHTLHGVGAEEVREVMAAPGQ